jgi:hypothetical protein
MPPGNCCDLAVANHLRSSGEPISHNGVRVNPAATGTGCTVYSTSKVHAKRGHYSPHGLRRGPRVREFQRGRRSAHGPGEPRSECNSCSGCFSSSDSSAPERKKSAIGCAPGVVNTTVIAISSQGGAGAVRAGREMGTGAEPRTSSCQTETNHPLSLIYPRSPSVRSGVVRYLAETSVLDMEAPEDRDEAPARCGPPEHRQSSDWRATKTSSRKRERQEILVPYAILVAGDRENVTLRGQGGTRTETCCWGGKRW